VSLNVRCKTVSTYKVEVDKHRLKGAREWCRRHSLSLAESARNHIARLDMWNTTDKQIGWRKMMELRRKRSEQGNNTKA